MRHAGKVVTHHQLLHEVWVHMSQLRRKLEAEPAHPRYLLTELGVSYRLKTA